MTSHLQTGHFIERVSSVTVGVGSTTTCGSVTATVAGLFDMNSTIRTAQRYTGAFTGTNCRGRCHWKMKKMSCYSFSINEILKHTTKTYSNYKRKTVGSNVQLQYPFGKGVQNWWHKRIWRSNDSSVWYNMYGRPLAPSPDEFSITVAEKGTTKDCVIRISVSEPSHISSDIGRLLVSGALVRTTRWEPTTPMRARSPLGHYL